MSVSLKLTAPVQELLRCPICKGRLTLEGEQFRCLNAGCRGSPSGDGGSFPIVNGVPILINERASVFTIADYVLGRDTFFARKSRLQRALDRLTPSISGNVNSRQHYERLAQELLGQAGRRSPSGGRPLVLVVGCGTLGQGMETLIGHPEIELVETDVAFGPRTALICDAHDLPFADTAFDAVVAQAVIEHVVDPYRCVAEIHRVLNPAGLVYAETPFMQQVHGKPYDFTRFTYLGHRRLFRQFEELESGVVCGPGMALAWSYQHFALSFVRSRAARRLLQILTSFTSFYLKYFDRYLAHQPAALDAAAGYYFMGRKSDRVLADRELIQVTK
jgi:SAM-dependent methyltransferase